MIRRLVTLALEQPMFVVLGLLLFIGGGIAAFQALPVEAFPDVSDNQVTVITLYPGRAAEEVEKQVTIPLEVALSGVPHSVRVFSHTQFGLSYLTITFDDKADDYFARQQVMERLRDASLPDGVEPQMAPLSTAIGEIYRFQLRGKGTSTQDLRTLQDWVVERQLRQVPGVADLVTMGGSIKTYEVRPNPAKLRDHGIGLQDLVTALQRGNANAGGGYVAQGSQQYLIRGIGLLAKPFVAVLDFFQSMIELTDEKNGAEEEPTQAENIDALISAGTEEGLIEEEDRKLIQSVVEFGDKVVREVMTPRPNIVAISVEASLAELRQLVIHEQYSRIPVFEGTIDTVVGFVHVRDMFELDEDDRASRTVRELMRPIRSVPETKPVNDLMREMQQDNTHMVMVVDEYGNTAGLASMEDLVEVILGEIRDEHEPDSDVQEDGEGGYIVSGSFDVARLSDLLEFHPEEDIESTTVGGLVTEWLGRVPAAGESVERGGIHIDVLASDELRVAQVRVKRSQAVAQ